MKGVTRALPKVRCVNVIGIESLKKRKTSTIRNMRIPNIHKKRDTTSIFIFIMYTLQFSGVAAVGIRYQFYDSQLEFFYSNHFFRSAAYNMCLYVFSLSVLSISNGYVLRILIAQLLVELKFYEKNINKHMCTLLLYSNS